MKKSLFIFSILCLCAFVFNGCKEETSSTSTTSSMEQLTDAYFKSFTDLSKDFIKSNEMVLKRGTNINFSTLKKAETQQELVTSLDQLSLEVDLQKLEAGIKNLERIETALINKEFSLENYEVLLKDKMPSTVDLSSESRMNCLKTYDYAIAKVGITAAGAATVSGGTGAPACIGVALAEIAAAEIAWQACLNKFEEGS